MSTHDEGIGFGHDDNGFGDQYEGDEVTEVHPQDPMADIDRIPTTGFMHEAQSMLDDGHGHANQSGSEFDFNLNNDDFVQQHGESETEEFEPHTGMSSDDPEGAATSGADMEKLSQKKPFFKKPEFWVAGLLTVGVMGFVVYSRPDLFGLKNAIHHQQRAMAHYSVPEATNPVEALPSASFVAPGATALSGTGAGQAPLAASIDMNSVPTASAPSPTPINRTPTVTDTSGTPTQSIDPAPSIGANNATQPQTASSVSSPSDSSAEVAALNEKINKLENELRLAKSSVATGSSGNSSATVERLKRRLKDQQAVESKLSKVQSQYDKTLRYSKELYQQLMLVANGKPSPLVAKMRAEGMASGGAAPVIGKNDEAVNQPFVPSLSNIKLKGVTPDVAIINMDGQDVYFRVGNSFKGLTLRSIDSAKGTVVTSVGSLAWQ